MQRLKYLYIQMTPDLQISKKKTAYTSKIKEKGLLLSNRKLPLLSCQKNGKSILSGSAFVI